MGRLVLRGYSVRTATDGPGCASGGTWRYHAARTGVERSGTIDLGAKDRRNPPLSLTAGDGLPGIRRRRHDAGRNQRGPVLLRGASRGWRHGGAILAPERRTCLGRELTKTVRSARVYVLRCGGPDHGGRDRNPPRIPACGSPLDPVGTFTRELVRLALEHSGRTSARAGNRVAGGGSAVTLQRDAAEVHACWRAARAFHREPGHGQARRPAEHRSSQCEAPLIAPAVVGASPCDGGC